MRVKDLGRFLGWRDNALVGYGIVTGLTGSGDSPSNAVTQQALKNALSRLGANITPEQVRSRNVAVVMVTATLPPSATPTRTAVPLYHNRWFFFLFIAAFASEWLLRRKWQLQ